VATARFPERGITPARIDRVVAKSGVAKPTRYRQSRSKAELAMACLEKCPVDIIGPRPRTAHPGGAALAMALSILVVDDERSSRAHLSTRLRCQPDVERVIECGNGAEAVEVIRTQRPDIVFLDVQLPGMTGFDVIHAVGLERMPLVVFVTACEEYATKAFEVDALDFLVKPYDEGRWRAALDRARGRLETGAAAALHRLVHAPVEREEPRKAIDRLAVKVQGRMMLLQVQDIDWLEARDNYVRLHVGSAFHLVRGKISTFEMRLDPRRFLRVHRGALVNVDQVAEVRSGLRGDVVVLKTGVQLPVGVTRREELLQRLGDLVGT
jgi:two-component system LytT family response regulator